MIPKRSTIKMIQMVEFIFTFYILNPPFKQLIDIPNLYIISILSRMDRVRNEEVRRRAGIEKGVSE